MSINKTKGTSHMTHLKQYDKYLHEFLVKHDLTHIKEFYGLIYKATNLINGKIYIGQTKNKLADIVEYVIRQEESNAPEDVLKAIRKIEENLQPSTWDEKRYTNTHRYIRLAAKKDSINQAMSAFEKGETASVQ